MEKRVFLVIFLSFLILAAYQSYFVPTTVPPAQVTSPATPGPAATPSPSAPTAIVAPPAVPSAAALVTDTEAREIVVETDHVQAVFSSRGASLLHWRLKKNYSDATGAPLDLVPQDVPPALPRPFTLATDDSGQSALLAQALFKPSAERLALGATPGTLSFEYRDASGLTARKSFHFQPEGRPYVLGVNAEVDVNGASLPVTLHWGPALSFGNNEDGSASTYPATAILYRDGDVERLSAGDIAQQPMYEGVFRFAGVGDHYFLSAAIPGTTSVRVEYKPISLPPLQGAVKPTPRVFVAYSIRTPGALSLPYFMGPKDFDILRDMDKGAPDKALVRAIDFGFFAFLVVPLLQALKWLNRFVGNYGWSIVLLTVLINVAMFPLRHRSMVSMKKMQALQPEVKAIQERFKKYKVTDPERQKMNQEMMALYKQKGVNPAGGCVPMLLTMPVLFAFYAMLSVAIELRGAHFFWWIRDLSVMDPAYVTPIFMGATMFWQQRMTPSTADPVQQKMFLFMPVIFTVMFLWAPAGLVIYWLVSNLMTIAQQYLTNHLTANPRAPRPPADRKLKPAGSGATAKAQGKQP